MQCPNCETENRDGAKFCDECGFPLTGAIARVAAATSSSDYVSKDVQEEKAEPVEEQVAEAIEAEEPSSEEPGAEEPKAAEAPLTIDETRPSESLEEEVESEETTESVDDRESDKGPQEDEVPKEAGEESGETRSEEGLEGLTEVIAAPSSNSDVTRQFNEDDFAGFTKHSDDGFSFNDPLSFDVDEKNPLNTQDPGFTMKMPRVEGEETAKSRDFMASATVPQKSHKKTIAIVVVIAVLIAAVAAATYFAGLWGGKVVPDVTNMIEADARAILEENGFTVRPTQVKSDETEGLVLVMDPESGVRVADGSEIVIHIATARLVPDIVGKTSEEAAQALKEAGYDNIRYEKVKHEGDENIVLSVEPEAGSRAKSNAEIVVNVSEAFRVPDISGMYLDGAFATIRDAGLEPQVVYVNAEEYIEGTIIVTTPEAGTVVPEGSLVSVNIAQSRATLLTSMTQSLLVPGSTVNVAGYNYTIDSLNSVSYTGNDTVAFSLTGRPYVSLFGEVVHASPQTVSGHVVWSPSNEVVSIG